ncbi:hypothetical protein B296_00011831 [Ensete ventricosum]|uniref:Uncharacterized protein n=1 Tax=Ensete ventricosum TaxID=4639 RepID=A0A427A0W1_ENSVE|nr:hypothetical protein B296_00011831 [Ensete ventricosum]
MNKDQESAWLEAQAIVISEDLVAAARRQLAFLAAVDRLRGLYDGPLLDRAICRYKSCWLPLLAKHCECGVTDGSLYAPLDCEWIWHCHRLNPVVQYKKDCEETFGRILNNHNVKSSLQGNSKHETTEKWSRLYPEEPFELDCSSTFSEEILDKYPGAASSISYDLVSAVKRQSSFCYQVAKPLLPFQNEFSKVFLEIVEVKNVPDSQKGDLFVSYSKKKPDMLFYGGTLSIQSESASIIGTTSISLQDLMNPDSELSIEKWFKLRSHSRTMDTEPVCLRVAVSFTVPVPAPFEFRMFKTHPISTNTCFLPLSGKEMFRSWTSFLDHSGVEVIRLCIRNLKKSGGSNTTASEKKVVGISRLWREERLLAEYVDNRWSLNDYNFSLVVEKIKGQDGSILEIKGDHQMKLFLGKGLEYESNGLKERNDKEFFATLVELSAKNPYGKAVALFDMKSSSVEVIQPFSACYPDLSFNKVLHITYCTSVANR